MYDESRERASRRLAHAPYARTQCPFTALLNRIARGETRWISQTDCKFLKDLADTTSNDVKYCEFTGKPPGSRRDCSVVVSALHQNHVTFGMNDKLAEENVVHMQVRMFDVAFEKGGPLDAKTQGEASKFYRLALKAAKLIHRAEKYALNGWTNGLQRAKCASSRRNRVAYTPIDDSRTDAFEEWCPFQVEYRCVSIENGYCVKAFRDDLFQDIASTRCNSTNRLSAELLERLKEPFYQNLASKYESEIAASKGRKAARKTCLDSRQAYPVRGDAASHKIPHHEYVEVRPKIKAIRAILHSGMPMSQEQSVFLQTLAEQHDYDLLVKKACRAFVRAFEALSDDNGQSIFADAISERNGVFVLTCQPASKANYTFLDDPLQLAATKVQVLHDLLHYNQNRLKDRGFEHVEDAEYSGLGAREIRSVSPEANMMDCKTRVAAGAIVIIVDVLFVACVQRDNIFLLARSGRCEYQKRRCYLEGRFCYHRGLRNSLRFVYMGKKNASVASTALVVRDDSPGRSAMVAYEESPDVDLDEEAAFNPGAMLSVTDECKMNEACCAIVNIIDGNVLKTNAHGNIDINHEEFPDFNFEKASALYWAQIDQRKSKTTLMNELNEFKRLVHDMRQKHRGMVERIEDFRKDVERELEKNDGVRWTLSMDDRQLDAFKRASRGRSTTYVQKVYGKHYQDSSKSDLCKKNEEQLNRLDRFVERFEAQISDGEGTFFDWLAHVRRYVDDNMAVDEYNGTFCGFGNLRKDDSAHYYEATKWLDRYLKVKKELDQNFCDTIVFKFHCMCNAAGLYSAEAVKWSANRQSLVPASRALLEMLNMAYLRDAILITDSAERHDAFVEGSSTDCENFMFCFFKRAGFNGECDLKPSGALIKFALKDERAWKTTLVVHMCALHYVSRKRVVQNSQQTQSAIRFDLTQVNDLFLLLKDDVDCVFTAREDKRPNAEEKFEYLLSCATRLLPDQPDWKLSELALDCSEVLMVVNIYAPSLMNSTTGFLPYTGVPWTGSYKGAPWVEDEKDCKIPRTSKTYLNSLFRIYASDYRGEADTPLLLPPPSSPPLSRCGNGFESDNDAVAKEGDGLSSRVNESGEQDYSIHTAWKMSVSLEYRDGV